jgi:hypothetical protein
MGSSVSGNPELTFLGKVGRQSLASAVGYRHHETSDDLLNPLLTPQSGKDMIKLPSQHTLRLVTALGTGNALNE